MISVMNGKLVFRAEREVMGVLSVGGKEKLIS